MGSLEHFGRFRPDLVPGSLDEILESGKPLSRETLINYLQEAAKFLSSEPGKHLQFRRENTPLWVGWWIDYLKNISEKTGKIIPFTEIKKETFAEPEKYGVLFSGGLEGHRGHRLAVHWILMFVKPILLLERDWYIEKKERGAPFLDLKARVSMWAYYNPDILVSVLPEKPKSLENDIHYKKMFDDTGARYCFASKADPYWRQKIERGFPAWFTAIPNIETESTTGMVRKLMPEIDFGEFDDQNS